MLPELGGPDEIAQDIAVLLPAPAETGRMIRDRLERIAAGEERLNERRERVGRALEELRGMR